jgi:hypothetical protein
VPAPKTQVSGSAPDFAKTLPGLLAATRTGLPPASDDELTTVGQLPTPFTSCLLGAREGLTEERTFFRALLLWAILMTAVVPVLARLVFVVLP